MPNQHVNKVTVNGADIIDLTADTVTPATLLSGYTAHDKSGAQITGTADGGAAEGHVWQDANGYLVLSDGSAMEYQSKSKTYTPTESQQSETISPDSGYDGLSSVSVSVGAISSSYVGSGIARKSSSDLTASGATVTAPAGYYASDATKSVASMTLPTEAASGGYGTRQAIIGRSTDTQYINIPTGYNDSRAYYEISAVRDLTPTIRATKGLASNHQISVTPSVVSAGGYLAAGTYDGTAVTVSASELVSGTKSISTSGETDVTNYEKASVDAASITVYAEKGTVSGNSVAVRPKMDSTTGLVGSGTTMGTAVTVTASELVSGTKSISTNGTGIDVTNYASVDVAVPTGLDAEKVIKRTLTTIEWPSDLTSVGGYAFAGCSSFNPPALPNSVITIGSNAFYGCSALSWTSLPSQLWSIAPYTFQSCPNLALTEFPSTLTSIGQYAFDHCSSITISAFPSALTTIGQYAFYYCTGLTSITIPSTVTSLGIYAFEKCTSLLSVVFSGSRTTIPQYCFRNCTSLTSVTFPTGLTTIDSSAFSNCSSLAITTLPDSVTVINNGAFQYCTSITSISCLGSITVLNSSAFTGDSNHQMMLESASFPNLAKGASTNVTIYQVFGNSTAASACQLLEFCDLGYLYSINSNSFQNCYSLETLVLRRTTSTTTLVNVSAFANTPMRGYDNKTGTVYVPQALISTYQSASNWSTLYQAGTVTFVAIEGSDYELED